MSQRGKRDKNRYPYMNQETKQTGVVNAFIGACKSYCLVI